MSQKSYRLTDVKNFKSKDIFDCGQCFRWNEDENGDYVGVVGNRVLRVHEETDGSVVFYGCDEKEFKEFWHNYFDLATDYSKIAKTLATEPVMKEATQLGEGIRILNQDVFECIISFIISANNNIPRIKGIIERFCEQFGDAIEFEGRTYYSFPKKEKLANLTKEDLAPLRAGFRDKYIIDAIKCVNSGEVNLDDLYNMSTDQARCELIKIKGIGRKVADCILLFSLNCKDSFPVDVWMRRVVYACYGIDVGDLQKFANERYGPYAGIAQQYLFYYAREKKIGKEG